MLSDDQIIELCNRMNIPLADKKGIIFKSEIKAKDLQYNKSYFINLDDEYDEKGKLNSGSHWTCFQIVKYPTGEIDPIYFDPFGIGAPEIIKESIMAFCKKKLPHTTKDIQSMLANACGWYCCAFLHFINNYPRRTGDVYDDTEIFLDYFDYYCRIDTDSYWLSPVTSNIFDDAEKNNAMYGFVNDSMYDAPDCAEGLWDAARKIVKEHPELEIYNKMSDIPELRYYSVNFELAYIPWFKQDSWRLFFNAIDKEGGIYKHRWGDHCIRYIGLKLFMHPDNIKRITNIHYRHQNEHYNPR
jgi:hypothetical protein